MVLVCECICLREYRAHEGALRFDMGAATCFTEFTNHSSEDLLNITEEKCCRAAVKLSLALVLLFQTAADGAPAKGPDFSDAAKNLKKKTKEDRSQVGLCRNEQTLPNQHSVRFFAFLEDTMTNSCALKFKIR